MISSKLVSGVIPSSRLLSCGERPRHIIFMWRCVSFLGKVKTSRREFVIQTLFRGRAALGAEIISLVRLQQELHINILNMLRDQHNCLGDTDVEGVLSDPACYSTWEFKPFTTSWCLYTLIMMPTTRFW